MTDPARPQQPWWANQKQPEQPPPSPNQAAAGKPIWQRPLTWVAAGVGFVVLLGIMASLNGGSQPPTTSLRPLTPSAPVSGPPVQAPDPAPTVTVTVTVTVTAPAEPKAPPEVQQAKPSSPEADPAEAPEIEEVLVPDFVGMQLQLAQDTAQARGLWVLTSHDVSGADRLQVLDRNWKVCSQMPEPGERVDPATELDFGAVKLTESCP